MKKGTRAYLPKPSFYKTALLFSVDRMKIWPLVGNTDKSTSIACQCGVYNLIRGRHVNRPFLKRCGVATVVSKAAFMP